MSIHKSGNAGRTAGNVIHTPPATGTTPPPAPPPPESLPRTHTARDHVAGRARGEAVVTTADVANTGHPAPAGATLRGHGLFPVSATEVTKAVRSGDLHAQAKVLHQLTTDRSNLLFSNDAVRVERFAALVEGKDAKQMEELRAVYVAQYGCDPETNIRSWDLLQPLARLKDDVVVEMVGVLNGPKLKETAQQLGALLDKAQRGPLGQEDRNAYYALMPMVGLWNAPLRADAAGMDSVERKLLTRELAGVKPGVTLDQAMMTLEAAMPRADLNITTPREKNIAVVVSSAGAQWQELMDWAGKMADKGYHLQLFTPNGQPVAFQHDSMCVDRRTAPLGHGCPPHLDPNRSTGDLARKLLANTAGAADFDPRKFGAVYSAGGLGFNEDVAVARREPRPGGGTEVVLRPNPNIDKMMQGALAEKLPQVALCHGPTLFAAIQMTVDGRREPVARGLETASLPPFEGYVGLTGRKEPMFTLDVNTHGELGQAGATTHVLKDVANMQRVVRSEKAGIEFITGPGPQTAANLADATVDAMQRRWQ